MCAWSRKAPCTSESITPLKNPLMGVEQKALGAFRSGSVTLLGHRQTLPEGDRLFAKACQRWFFRETHHEKSYLVAGRPTFHYSPQHTDLPPQSTPGLLVDDGHMLIQFLGEHLVDPIVTSKVPSLEPGQLDNGMPTRTKLTGIDSASGTTSRAQCQAAIMMRSAVAFATLGRGHFRNTITLKKRTH